LVSGERPAALSPGLDLAVARVAERVRQGSDNVAEPSHPAPSRPVVGIVDDDTLPDEEVVGCEAGGADG
jgi:hypothetical protein